MKSKNRLVQSISLILALFLIIEKENLNEYLQIFRSELNTSKYNYSVISQLLSNKFHMFATSITKLLLVKNSRLIEPFNF